MKVTPYEVGIMKDSPGMTEPLFAINRLVDLVFWTDIGINFNLMCVATETPPSPISVTRPSSQPLPPGCSSWNTLLHFFGRNSGV